MEAKYSWVTRDEQYHQQKAIGIESILAFFLRLFFDNEVKWLHLEKVEENAK